MLVALGPRQVEVTHRALVVGVLDDGDDEEEALRMVDLGADAVVGGAGLVTSVPVVTAAELAALGALHLPAPSPETDRETALAMQSLAITRGARVVATRDVRGTRRVADVLAAILARP